MGGGKFNFHRKAMEVSNAKRMFLDQFDTALSERGLSQPTREVGQIVSLGEGDIFTLGRVGFTNVRGSIFTDEDTLATGGFYFSEAEVELHTGIHAVKDIPDAMFGRSGKKFPSLENQVTDNRRVQENLAGFSLYESILNSSTFGPDGSQPLSQAQKELNLDLTKHEDARAKLLRLEGRTFRIIKSVIAWRTKMVPEKASDEERKAWGTKPSHWTRVNLLFFEEITPESQSAEPVAPVSEPAPARRGRPRNTNR